MGNTGQESSSRRLWRRARIAGLVAVLALLVVAPVALAAVTSSTTYSNFASDGAQGDNHWSNTNQTVTIAAVPSTDTTATVYFSSNNGGSYSHQTYSTTGTAAFSFVVTDEGSNAVKFYATDSTPATQSAYPPTLAGYINIDKTKPVTTQTGLAPVNTQSPDADWSQDATHTVTLAATDTVPSIATSGVRWNLRRINSASVVTSTTASVTFTLVKGSGGVVEGANTVTYSAVDWAGNIETTHTGYINIDTVAPATTASPALATSATTGWRNKPVTVTLDWTDVSSGVPTGGTSYRVNDGNPTIYVSPFPVSSEGSTKLTYRSIDRAANVEATQTAYVNIDTGAPTASFTTAPSRSSGWYNKDVVVTIVGQDAVSGIAKTQYRLQGAIDWIDAAGNAFTVLSSDNAIETFDYQALDNAGNASAAAALTLNMDSIQPTTHGKDVTGKVNKSIPLKYKVKDNLSPKAQSLWIKIKNSSGKTVKSQTISGSKKINTWYTYDWKPKSKGTYKYYVYGKDLAGNSQKSPGWAKIKVN